METKDILKELIDYANAFTSNLEALWQIIGAFRKNLNYDEFSNVEYSETANNNLLQTANNDCDVEIKFTDKEMKSMPQPFRNKIKINGQYYKARRRKTGKNTYSIQIRCRRDGYNISASGATIELAKQNFITALNNAVRIADKNTAVSTLFNEFAIHFFENYYKERVVITTYYNLKSIFNRHIKPRFDKLDIRKITPSDCKNLLNEVKAKGLGKTADEVYSILNQVLKMAIAYNIIQRNPLAVVPYKQHERVNGERLTVDEEIKLLEQSRPNYKPIFAIFLYCGIRPNEIYDIRIEKPFIFVRNSKQKDHKIRYKKIPIQKKLLPYLNEELPHIPKLDYIRAEFKRILPNHTLKDCRRTFKSHCEECGIDKNLSEVWLGHSLGKLNSAYIEFSDEFMLQEIEKLYY